MPVPKNISEAFYKKVLSNMKKDNILRRVMNDDLILRFGERMYYKRDLEEHTADKWSHERISTSCRMLEGGHTNEGFIFNTGTKCCKF